MDYPTTTHVSNLFIGRVIDNAAVNRNKQRFCISLEATSLDSKKSEVPITPGFASLEDLEKFCQQNWSKFLGLDMEIREMGILPSMWWEEENAAAA